MLSGVAPRSRWPPLGLLGTTGLARGSLTARTDESLGDLFDAALWRDAGGALVGR